MLNGKAHAKYHHPTYSGPRTFLQLPSEPVGQSTGDDVPDVTVVGIPFDLGTTNRPGARFGPSAIRESSLMLNEGENPNYNVEPGLVLKCIDAGDVLIASGYLEESLKTIEEELRLVESKQLVVLGGDHSITWPILRARKHIHGEGISLLHFDAHVDTWQDSFGSAIGHGTPFHYACEEKLIDPKKSVQIGIRSPIDLPTRQYSESLGFTVLSSEDVHMGGVEETVRRIRETIGTNRVYLTFDIDAIDPSMAPGTGTPEVGGLFTWQVLAILRRLQDLEFVGMDIVEVAPAYDVAQITSLAGATIAWTYLSILAKQKQSREQAESETDGEK